MEVLNFEGNKPFNRENLSKNLGSLVNVKHLGTGYS